MVYLAFLVGIVVGFIGAVVLRRWLAERRYPLPICEHEYRTAFMGFQQSVDICEKCGERLP
jgi:hypothetical protein